jgi:6-pyruvoyl-tetrahydropterin synthase
MTEDNETRTLTVERSTSTAHRLANYDGACHNIHGHNLEWEVEVTLDVDINGVDNMGIDFKEVSDLIDDTDHAMLMSEEEIEIAAQSGPFTDIEQARQFLTGLFGDIIWFDGDPTVELLTKWMARRIYEANDAITHVDVSCHETDKYGLSAEYNGSESIDRPQATLVGPEGTAKDEFVEAVDEAVEESGLKEENVKVEGD